MSTEFNDQQLRQIYPEGIRFHYWTRARLWHIEDALKGVRDKVILEVGCGAGVAARALRGSGYELYGCDLCAGEATEEERAFLFYETDFKDLPAELLARVEVVILLDVLEHIEEPVPFLERIRAALPQLSEVLVTLPARAELWSNFDEFNGHFLRYDLKSLSLLDAPGLELSRSSYLFQLLYLPAWLTVRLLGGRGETISPPRGALKLVHGLIARVLYLSSRALSYLPMIPGTSVIATYRVSQ